MALFLALNTPHHQSLEWERAGIRPSDFVNSCADTVVQAVVEVPALSSLVMLLCVSFQPLDSEILWPALASARTETKFMTSSSHNIVSSSPRSAET